LCPDRLTNLRVLAVFSSITSPSWLEVRVHEPSAKSAPEVAISLTAGLILGSSLN
jgi:hypothetical protein